MSTSTSGELAALHSSVDRLAAVVGALGPDQLERPAYPSEWTIADTLSHIGSGAVILRQRFVDLTSGAESDPAFNQTVWDEWNAKTPEAQATDVLVADAALVAALDALDDAHRAEFRFVMGPFDLDFAGFAGLRLNEHAVHTWDVEVFEDPAAVLPEAAAAVMLDRLATVAGFSGRPTGTEHTVTVGTRDPARGFAIALGAEGLVMSATEAPGSPDVELPAESFIRLVYGRLDPDHTPAGVEGPVVDELRRAFPGF